MFWSTDVYAMKVTGFMTFIDYKAIDLLKVEL